MYLHWFLLQFQLMEWLTKFLLCRSFSFMVYQWTSVSVYSFLSFIFFIFSPSSFTAHSFSFVVASFHFFGSLNQKRTVNSGKASKWGKKRKRKRAKSGRAVVSWLLPESAFLAMMTK